MRQTTRRLVTPVLTLTLLVGLGTSAVRASGSALDGDTRVSANNAEARTTWQRPCGMVHLLVPDAARTSRNTTVYLVAAGGKCDEGGDYYEACSGVGLTTWDTCRAAGGSKDECEKAAQQSQNNCMRDFGCPPIVF